MLLVCNRTSSRFIRRRCASWRSWSSYMEELFINCRRDETMFVKKKGAGIHNSPDDSRGEGVGGPGEAVSPTDSVQCEPLRYKERYFVLMFTLWGLFGTDINVTCDHVSRARSTLSTSGARTRVTGVLGSAFAERFATRNRAWPSWVACLRAPRAWKDWCTGPRVGNAVWA